MVKLGKYKNCKKRLMNYGLSEKEAEIGCARYLTGDDEWSVKTAAALGKTGFEVENPVEEPAKAFAVKKPKVRKKQFKLEGPEEVTYRSLPFWKGWTPAGGKGAGRLEPEARRPEKATPLTSQMPLFQPWRSQKSQHRLQTKLEKVQTEEQKYLTQEQLAKRSAYAVSIKKRDSGELEITLPAIILDQLSPQKQAAANKLTIPKGGGMASGPKMVKNEQTGEMGFWAHTGKKAYFISMEKGKGHDKPKKEKVHKKTGKIDEPKVKTVKEQMKFQSPIKKLESGDRSKRLAELLSEKKFAPLKETLGKMKETRGITGLETFEETNIKREQAIRRQQITGEGRPNQGPTRKDQYLKHVHIYPMEEEVTDDPTNPDYEASRNFDKYYLEKVKESYYATAEGITRQIPPEEMSDDEKFDIMKLGNNPAVTGMAKDEFLVYQAEVGEHMTNTEDIFTAIHTRMNNHIREELVNKLRKKASDYIDKEGNEHKAEPLAQDYVKRINAARLTYEKSGKYTTEGKGGNPPIYKLRPAWQQKNPKTGTELIARDLNKLEKAQESVSRAFDMEMGLLKEKAEPPAAKVIREHADLTGEEFLTRGYKLAKAKVARREKKAGYGPEYKKFERLTLWSKEL